MDDADIDYCINCLVDAIDEGEDSWKYEGSESARLADRLLPIVIEALNLPPEELWIGPEKLKRELNALFLAAKGEENPANFVREWTPEFRDWLYDKEIKDYQVAFPLNFAHRSSDLIPDQIRISDVNFNRITHEEWTDRFRPENNSANDALTNTTKNFKQFLDKSPNDLDSPKYTYWFVDIRARDPSYPIHRVTDRLEVLLAMLNYSATFGRVQTMSGSQGPWPSRWADLRDPFVKLLYSGGKLERYRISRDPSHRKLDSPHSMAEEMFEDIFESIPNFEDESSLDSYIFNSLRSYQAAITEPVEREAFFDFWRGIEILALTDEDSQMKDIVERATAMIEWNHPQFGEIRMERVKNKRNSYVHDGDTLDISTGDRNILKTIHESLISHYFERRNKWTVEQMEFGLDNFTTNPGKIRQLRDNRSKELEVLDWFDSISETD